MWMWSVEELAFYTSLECGLHVGGAKIVLVLVSEWDPTSSWDQPSSKPRGVTPEQKKKEESILYILYLYEHKNSLFYPTILQHPRRSQ